MSALDQKPAAALASREDRGIRGRLPPATLSHLPPTPDITSDQIPDVPSGAPTAVSTTIAAASIPTSAVPADFSSNDYLSLSTSPLLRSRVLAMLNASPAILGSGGSRLIVYNHAHASLEDRLARTFRAPAALLVNSGFDANAGFFACVPQPGQALLYDTDIHASVHDWSARIARRTAFPPPVRA